MVDPRWVRDPSDELALAEGCWFDEAAGERPCAFIERFCRQSKGRWSGQPLRLLDWQRDFLRRLFGWKRADGTRRYRTAYLEVAKKNGKSTLLSGLELYLLLGDKEGSPEIYVNACNRQQASIIYEESAKMVRASPDLSSRLKVVDSRKTIFDPVGYGKILANSKEAGSKDGLNPSATLFDELHRQPDRQLWDVFEYASAARSQPLKISITTAGEDAEGVWYEQREKSEKVNSGEVADTTHLGVVYRALDADDLDDPATWRKANPSLGSTISEEDFRRELEEAKRVPTKLANFKRLRLNLITRSEGKFLAPGQWDACSAPTFPEMHAKTPTYAGLDLSSINDLTALVWVAGDAETGFDVSCRFFLPEDNIVDLEHEHGQPYRTWADLGVLTLTPGNVIDYAYIRAEVVALAGRCDLRKLLSDPFMAAQLAVELREEDGLPVEFLRQGFLSLNAPTKELQRLILCRKLRHDGNPVLRWMAGNAVAEQDAAGNIKLSKRKSRHKIDGMAALVNAIAAATSGDDDSGRSVYEERGMLFL